MGIYYRILNLILLHEFHKISVVIAFIQLSQYISAERVVDNKNILPVI